MEYALNDEVGLPYGYDFLWFVTNYTDDGYGGHGDAVGYDGENFYIFNLSHCSCGGPMDEGPDIIHKSKVKFEKAISGLPESCEGKIIELLAQE